MNPVCADCGRVIEQEAEKDLQGTWAVVWSDAENGWVCPKTGNEHRPTTQKESTA